MSTIERDELDKCYRLQPNCVMYSDARRIVDALKAKLAEVTRDRDGLQSDLDRVCALFGIEARDDGWLSGIEDSESSYDTFKDAIDAASEECCKDQQRLAQAREQLSAVQAEAAAMFRLVEKYAMELRDERDPEHFQTESQRSISYELDLVRKVLDGTAGRDLLDEMKRKDGEIQSLKERQQHLVEAGVRYKRKARTAKRALVEYYRGKLDPSWFGEQQPTPEPVWQYRAKRDQADGQTTVWRNGPNGVYVSARFDHMPNYQSDWSKSVQFNSWTQVEALEGTFPCNESGERIEDHIADTGKMVDDDPPPSKCKSCGVPYTDHLGIQGTCKQLQEATAAIHGLVQERNRLSDQLAEQAPLIAIARDLREALKGTCITTIANSHQQMVVIDMCRAESLAKAIDKLRDAKGGDA